MYQELAEKYPKSNLPKKLPLEFLDGELFLNAASDYIQSQLRKGVPSLFKDLKYILEKDSVKKNAVRELLQKENSNKEEANVSMWTHYFLAQLHDHDKNIDAALDSINRAIEVSDKTVELLLFKGKIYKHAGNLEEAVKWMLKAQDIDKSDRFANMKCSKYQLRANQINESIENSTRTIPVNIRFF